QRLLFVFIYEYMAKRPGQPPVLSGFFPLVEGRGYKGWPVRRLTLWQHAYSVLGAPLVRQESAREAWAAVVEWAGSGPRGCALVQLPLFPGQGPLHRGLIENCHRCRRLSYVDEAYTRAFFLPRADTATYRALALGGHHNRDMRRQERCLARMGR